MISLVKSQVKAAPLDEQHCWNAVQRRDAAFDGRFFFGVLTTGVYCRPSCASRRALRKNTRLFYLETPSNPLTEVSDIAALADISRKAGAGGSNMPLMATSPAVPGFRAVTQAASVPPIDNPTTTSESVRPASSR